MFSGLSRYARILVIAGAAVVCFTLLSSRAGAPTVPPKHGLTGSYYLGHGGWQTDAPPPASEFNQVWSDPNDFMIPRIITAPAATRVDAQVAFGQGKGFHVGEKGPAVAWWPTGYAIPQGWGYTEKPWAANHFVAAIWKGYIHLPKAGTYYFGTTSNGASAVYLNQARVALNGWGGGVLVSDGFSYDSNQVHDFVTQNSSAQESYRADPRFQYAVPVPVEGPRDLPIEVDYDVAKSPSNWGNVALGIDLFWVTPDSPRDATGKPVAAIVPSEALYTEEPSPIDKPIVRSANSTISADYFYVAAKSDNYVTVTVRLADKDGNPVAGKRVSLASVAGQRDEILQPEKPTNEQGETTGKIRGYQGYSVPHETAIFAADMTDFVGVGQVGHVMFTNPTNSFFPDSFSPYYDPHAPEVTPTPLQVGRQVTVKMPLVNRNTYAANLDVIFEIHEWNIGASNWEEIGRVKNVRLQPGEHKDVSIQWTPDQATGHICFRVSVNATKIAFAPPPVQPLFASLLPVFLPQGSSSQKAAEPTGGQQTRNIGPVAPPDCKNDCQTINDMLGLIKGQEEGGFYPTSFKDFCGKFDPLLKELTSCCSKAGRDATCASFVQQIQRDRAGLKTLSNTSVFPSMEDCPPMTPAGARCDDYNSIQRIKDNLNRLAKAQGCIGGKHRPHLACPEMETLEKIKEYVERDEKLTHFLSEHSRKNDPELTKGFEDAEKGFGRLASFLSKLIKLGKSCEEIKKILSELQALFNAINEINNAGCDTQKVAKGFDDLVKAAAALAQNLPIVNWDPELAGIVDIFAQDKNFFENMSCALNPECRWRREFQNVDGYIPDCPSAMGSSPQ